MAVCMSGRMTASSNRAPSQSKDDAPLGIIVIAVLGIIVTVFGLIAALGVVAQSGGPMLLGLFLVGLSGGQLLVLLGLLALKPWAWTWGLVLFGIGAFIDLMALNVVGLAVSLVIIVYLISKADYYQ